MKSTSKLITLILAFIITTLASCLVGQYLRGAITARNQAIDQEEIKIVQEIIKERFNLFLDVSQVIGQIAAKSLVGSSNENYGRLVQDVFAEKPYFLGLNRLDIKGEIIAVYPEDHNSEALGQITQNYHNLLESIKRGKKFWFSPPFQLYQSGVGFVIYVPIFRGQKLEGWTASVINSQKFFERFRAMDFFKTYELLIKDELTGGIYFNTAEEPSSVVSVSTVKAKTLERSIVLKSWRKKEKQVLLVPWYWDWLMALLIASLVTFGARQFIQRWEVTSKLDSVRKLLRLTSGEMLNNLMEMHSEYLTLGATGYLRTKVVEEDVMSITNLVEQMDLLQSMAEPSGTEEETFPILPEVKVIIQEMEDFTLKKNLRIELDESSFHDVKTTGNRWLFRNTVLKNILTHCLIHTRQGKRIEVSFELLHKKGTLSFQCEEVVESENDRSVNMTRRLLVAKNTMKLMDGNLVIHEARKNGVAIKMALSAS